MVRLKNLGIPIYLVASALNGIVAQRLLRKICPQCKEAYTPTADELKRMGMSASDSIQLYRGRGCKSCNGIGYAGRVGIFEVLGINNKIRDMIAQDGSEQDLNRAAAEAGMTSLLMDGLKKVIDGTTTLEELSRVVYLSREDKGYEGVCPSCLQPITPDSEECPHCGSTGPETCLSCGKARQPSWIICPYCATIFESKKPLRKSESLS